MGDRALRDRLLGMTPQQVVAYWAALQAQRRAAGEAHYRTLYAAAAGPRQNDVLATVPPATANHEG